MKVVLISTYELGHQPFGLASPAAWLGAAGASLTCIDLAVEDLDEQAVKEAGLIGVYLPMHTATRLASALMPRLLALNPAAHVCFYGLYAPLNADFLRGLGGRTFLGGEFENALVRLYERLSANGAPPLADEPVISFAKQRFRVPERGNLPALSRYAHLEVGAGERRTVGYTEASRGCKHHCRHCPVVPVYGGRFFVVQADVVIEDIRRQVAAGARHITFGDPDFFNGIGHALRLVRALAAEFPRLTYDATIKIEHLLKHSRHLATLAETGCLFVVTAVESIEDRVLELLDKGHTRADFMRAVGLARAANLTLSPTFIPFTPWTSLEGYLDLVVVLAELDLVAHVAPIQLAMRLLLPSGSLLLALPELKALLGEFDAGGLSQIWHHADPRVDDLQARVRRIVEAGETAGLNRRAIFERILGAARAACGLPHRDLPAPALGEPHVPRLSEPWFCCAEPTGDQLARV
ncbi:MAG: CUAEP/CCAEP-tail radical SAM (seleno)protein [Pseudomonadota bacterium]